MTSGKYCWNHKASSKYLWQVVAVVTPETLSGSNLHSEARAASEIPWIPLTPWKLTLDLLNTPGDQEASYLVVCFWKDFSLSKTSPELCLLQMVLDCLAQVRVKSQPLYVWVASLGSTTSAFVAPIPHLSLLCCNTWVPGTFSQPIRIIATAQTWQHWTWEYLGMGTSTNMMQRDFFLKVSFLPGPTLPCTTFYWDKFGY